MKAPYSEEYKPNKVFPCPREEKVTEGSYKLKENYNTEDLYSFYCAVKNGTRDITYVSDLMLEKEEYILAVTTYGVKITASTDEGRYRAVTSLRLLVEADGDTLQCCEIKDKPDLKFRSWLLDVGHAYRPNLETLKRYVDFASGMKGNAVLIYMEPLCFKYPAFPQHTDFDCLTPEDIVELDKYAKDRFVELVPAINGFGHMREWLEIDEFRHLALGDGVNGAPTINPLLDESYEFIDKLFGSILPYFSTKRAFIGFDEVFGLEVYQTKEECEKRGKLAVFMDWMKKIASLTYEKYGKDEVVVFHDMFADSPEYYREFPDYVTVAVWNYSQTQLPLIEGYLRDVKDNGIKKFYTASASETYTTYMCRSDLAIENIRLNAEMAYKYGAEGVVLTEWTRLYPIWAYLPCAFSMQLAWNVGQMQATDAAYFKMEYWHEAENYCDKYVFKAPVSRLIFRLGNMYLLEPERIHGSSMSGWAISKPIEEQRLPYFYDMAVVGDDFCFDNMIDYTSKLISKVQAIDFDEILKRQLILSGKISIFASECCRIKTHLAVTKKKAEETARLADWILEENDYLWPRVSFRGKHDVAFHGNIDGFINDIKSRRDEILRLAK